MYEPSINFDSFDLPFILEDDYSEVLDTLIADKIKGVSSSDVDNLEEEDEELDQDEVKEKMEDQIPKTAICLGSIETELRNWTSWTIEDDYYIIPIEDSEFDWAIFRISWDDNFGEWNWAKDAQVKGFKDDYMGAAKYALPLLFEHWEVADEKIYKSFLEEL